jgi:hypothetical protein
VCAQLRRMQSQTRSSAVVECVPLFACSKLLAVKVIILNMLPHLMRGVPTAVRSLEYRLVCDNHSYASVHLCDGGSDV